MMLHFSPMEQFNLFPLLTLHLDITQHTAYLALAAVLVVALGSAATYAPSFLSLLAESQYCTVLSMVEGYAGVNRFTAAYFPLVFTVFYVVLFSNLLGMIPYSIAVVWGAGGGFHVSSLGVGLLAYDCGCTGDLPVDRVVHYGFLDDRVCIVDDEAGEG
ncbi:hypothetical protein BDK51DRAFT_35083 [Blyttiomyces helicus]|uniref:ATP synthase subunit a n=1 Tax=Blyttiomyces helicus TaxID=388810 RepID=A0A4P9WGQ8_9FUNG|nr:hypothetical protein BDK51DRAFT_35083 [Blyttiomyces helicus]|eukprot:RKO89686.1 hypothetical protein BDK51DRAFT_35083 [Blyttiomyces helicus]